MATPTEIQAQLDPQGTGKKINIQTKFSVSVTDSWYCVAGIESGLPAGRNRWVTSTSTDNAATQAASIIAGMIA